MIILLNPRAARWKFRLPLSVMALGAALEGRYAYTIVDGNLENDVAARVFGELQAGNIRYLAVTVMPGPQLAQAIELCRAVRARGPAVTIIWGGYFPSLHTGVVLESGYVDFVIQGQGDLSLLELIDALERGGPVNAIPGLAFRRGGAIVTNPRREVAEAAFQTPYHRVDVRRYLGRTCLGSRTLSMHTSFGCPFLCGFCAVAGVYKGRWNGKAAAAIVREALHLRDEYGANAIEFIDNNFFVSEKRTSEIAEGLRGSGIAWWGEARPDTVMAYSDKTWNAMRAGGCRMMFFGSESSSDAVLSLMDKGGTQTADTTLRLARSCREFDIIPEFSFVLGAPGDDVDAQLENDIRYIRRIKEINPRSEIIIYVYSPVFFDDAPLLARARRYGFDFPGRLEDWLDPQWINFSLRKDPRTPWLEQRHIDRILDFERVLNARFPTVSDIRLTRFRTGVLKALGSWRYHLGFYYAPWEIRFVANRLFRYRQPEVEGF